MRRTFALVTVAGVSVAIACSEAYAPGADDADAAAPAEGGVSDAPGGNDGPAVEADAAKLPLGTHAPRCPRPNGPSCAPSDCERRVLYAPPTAGVEFPFDIAVDSAFVYWTALSAGDAADIPYDGRGTATIRRVRREPGSTPSVIADGQRDATAIAVAGDHLYWAAANGSLTELRRVRRDCPDRCVVETAAQLGAEPFVALVDIDAQTLLATAFSGRTFVITIPKTGNPILAETTTSSYIPSITTTSTEGFAAGGVTPAVMRIPAATRVAVPFATLPDAAAGQATGFSAMATDCTTLFGWRVPQQLWKLPLEGGTPTELAMPIMDLFGLAADSAFIYAGAANNGGVHAIAIDTGVRTTLQPGSAFRLAVDELGMYWGDHDKNTGGALWMLVK